MADKIDEKSQQRSKSNVKLCQVDLSLYTRACAAHAFAD